jgi:hypothetical protein
MGRPDPTVDAQALFISVEWQESQSQVPAHLDWIGRP